MQLEAANQEVFHLQSQLQDSQQQLEQQLPSQHQVSYPSLSGHLESQLRAQISKNEYEVARQAAQILELQGELTKVQVSFDRSAQRQTETNAQLTRQESTTSRYAASNSLLQEQVEEAQITAASQENRIKQLDSQLSGSNKSLTEARQCCAQLGDEAQQHKELAVKHTSEMEKLQTQLDESTSAASSAAALEEKLQQQLHAQQEEQSLMQRQSEETIELLQVSVSAKTSEHQSLQAEVYSFFPKTRISSLMHNKVSCDRLLGFSRVHRALRLAATPLRCQALCSTAEVCSKGFTSWKLDQSQCLLLY